MGRIKDWLLAKYQSLNIPEPEEPDFTGYPDDPDDVGPLTKLSSFDDLMQTLNNQFVEGLPEQEPF